MKTVYRREGNVCDYCAETFKVGDKGLKTTKGLYLHDHCAEDADFQEMGSPAVKVVFVAGEES